MARAVAWAAPCLCGDWVLLFHCISHEARRKVGGEYVPAGDVRMGAVRRQVRARLLWPGTHTACTSRCCGTFSCLSTSAMAPNGSGIHTGGRAKGDGANGRDRFTRRSLTLPGGGREGVEQAAVQRKWSRGGKGNDMGRIGFSALPAALRVRGRGGIMCNASMRCMPRAPRCVWQRVIILQYFNFYYLNNQS